MADDDVRTAMTLRDWLRRERAGENPVTAAGVPLETLDAEIWNIWPDARVFGKPALAAFTAKVLPRGCCRFGLLAVESFAARVPTPPMTRALRTLLGEPCPSCLGGMRAELVARVDAGTTPAVRARANRQAIIASARANGHPTGTCKRCHEYRTAVRGALTTAGSAVELPALLPHKARLASTGRVDEAKPSKPKPKTYGHDIEGVICNCQPCRAKRARRRPADPSDRAHALAARR